MNITQEWEFVVTTNSSSISSFSANLSTRIGLNIHTQKFPTEDDDKIKFSSLRSFSSSFILAKLLSLTQIPKPFLHVDMDQLFVGPIPWGSLNKDKVSLFARGYYEIPCLDNMGRLWSRR